MVGKTVSLKEFVMEKKFTNEVLQIIASKQTNFSYIKNGNHALFHLIEQDLHVFIKYIEKGIMTSLPSIISSFNYIINEPKVSSGQWVVEYIDSLPNDTNELANATYKRETLDTKDYYKLLQSAKKRYKANI